MQKAGLPSFLSKKITDSDITTQTKTDNFSNLFKEDASTGCKIIISLKDGQSIRDKIVKQNTAALEHYMGVLHSVDKKFNIEKNEKKNEREVDPKKVSNIVLSREKELETGKKSFVNDIKKTIGLVDARIHGTVQFKKTGKLSKDSKEKAELECVLTSINPLEKKIYFRVEGAAKGEIEHSVDTKYLCFDSNKKSAKSPTRSPSKTKKAPVPTEEEDAEPEPVVAKKTVSPKRRKLEFKKDDT